MDLRDGQQQQQQQQQQNEEIRAQLVPPQEQQQHRGELLQHDDDYLSELEGDYNIEEETVDNGNELLEQHDNDDNFEDLDGNLSDIESDEAENYQDYRNILKKLSEDWIINEITHRVSKQASDSFWKLANEHFFALYSLKTQQGVTRKIPQFQHLRRNLYKKNVPKVTMEIGYECKANGEIMVVEDIESTPISKFPPSTHRRLYEIASVKVSLCYILYTMMH